MRFTWFKSAIALGALVMVAGVSVPVSVSASTAHTAKTEKTAVSPAKLDHFSEQLSNLTPATVAQKVGQMSDQQIHNQITQTSGQLKATLQSAKLSNALSSISLADLKHSVTTQAVAQAKKAWTPKMAHEVQAQLAAGQGTAGLSATQAKQVQNVNVAQSIQDLTPAQFVDALAQMTSNQWQQITQKLQGSLGQLAQNLKNPTVAQVRNASQNLPAKQLNQVQKAVKSNSDYYTDLLNNGSQATLKAEWLSTLPGLLLPAFSIMAKLGAFAVGTPLIVAGFAGVLNLVVLAIQATTHVLITLGTLLLPIIGIPANLALTAFNLLLTPLTLFNIGLASLVGGVGLSLLLNLLLPILPAIPTIPAMYVLPRLDQTISYADSLKSGHQYTQAVNVQAGQSYRIEFKADQAADQSANYPMTNFGTLTYGLVANQTDKVTANNVSDLITNVKNGSATITSRAKTINMITFDAKKTGTLYLVADTAKAAISKQAKQDSYADTTLWYVNSAIDVALTK